MLSAAYMKGNPARLIDPASVRPSINRGPSGPVRNTLFRGKLVNRLTLHHSLLALAPLLPDPANHAAPREMGRRPNAIFFGIVSSLKKS